MRNIDQYDFSCEPDVFAGKLTHEIASAVHDLADLINEGKGNLIDLAALEKAAQDLRLVTNFLAATNERLR